MTDFCVMVLASPEAVAEEAARRFRSAACRAVKARGRFCVALSGGGTPRQLYELLARDPWRYRLPWSDTRVFWSDERCVPPEHPDSNFGMAERLLLRHVDVPSPQVHRMKAELGAVEGALAYEATLDVEVGRVGLDFVLLGMGDDGHTASLFPGASVETPRRVVPVVAPDGRPRITLTLSELNAASEVLFLVTGAGKRDVVTRALGSRGDDPSTLPARRVSPTQAPVWLLDHAAAAELTF